MNKFLITCITAVTLFGCKSTQTPGILKYNVDSPKFSVSTDSTGAMVVCATLKASASIDPSKVKEELSKGIELKTDGATVRVYMDSTGTFRFEGQACTKIGN